LQIQQKKNPPRHQLSRPQKLGLNQGLHSLQNGDHSCSNFKYNKKKHLSQEKSPLELITITQTFPQKFAEESDVDCSLKNFAEEEFAVTCLLRNLLKKFCCHMVPEEFADEVLLSHVS
jgi:hypothetical protein